MPRKRKLSNLGDRCRFCLARDSCMSELFVDWVRPKLADLEKCSSIEILDKPNYPKNICYVCLYKVEMWSDFKEQFLKSNKTLLTHFKVLDEPIDENIELETDVADDHLSDENKKRPKLNSEVHTIDSSSKLSETASTVTGGKCNNRNSNEIIFNKEDIDVISTIDIKPVTVFSSTPRKLDRLKRIERKASTIRWVERKKALIAASGEVFSESESDNESQLSPVQMARAKSNDEKEIEKQKKKIEKVLKKLETDMTDKYKIKHEDIVYKERKTRSRRSNIDEAIKHNSSKSVHEPKNVDLPITKKSVELKSNINHEKQKSDVTDLDRQPIIVIDEEEQLKVIKEVEKKAKILKETNNELKNDEKEKQVKDSEKVETQINNVEEIEKSLIVVEEKEEKLSEEVTKTEKLPENVEEIEKESKVLEKTKQQSKTDEEIDNEIEIVEIENEESDTNLSQQKKQKASFVPQLVTSEVTFGNATYVITTMLDTPETASSSDISLKTNGISIDATNQDGKKIDLMNAVQLQKVHLQEKNRLSKLKINNEQHKVELNYSDIQKCLKIEIEGMEMEALQSIQLELAHFLNTDMSKRILENAPKEAASTKQGRFKDSYENLQHQLKTIIEKVLRSNYEAEKLSGPIISNHSKISHEFIKAAAHSPIFQPKVIVSRLNIRKLCKKFRINNLRIFEEVKRRKGLVGPLSRSLGKRQPILPKKYSDFSMTMNIGDVEDEKKKAAIVKPISNKAITVNNIDLESTDTATTEQPHVSNDVINNVQKDDSITETSHVSIDITNNIQKEDPLITIKPPLGLTKELPSIKALPSISEKLLTSLPTSNKTSKNSLPINKQLPIIRPLNNTPKKPKCHYRHVCGLCHKELHSKEEAEAHVKSHKVEMTTLSSTKKSTSVSPKSSSSSNSQSLKPKPKLMRCKRCHAIVEAKHVKTHACNSVKYNCTLCDCRFGAEHLLVAHLETHSSYKSKNKPKSSPIKNKPLKEVKRLMIVKENANSMITEPEVEEDLEEMLADKEPQGYSCFVCDKVFVDEEQMKDHLQMHCEEVSDEGNEKGFQCAFCGEKFQSEECLETHVGNHLMDDGDEKINMLINMDVIPKSDKQKRTVFKCEQCSESFPSSLLLAMHLPLHEEEDSNAYEKQDGEQEHHVCSVCDEIFETPEELSEHLDVHNGNEHVCILCEKPFSSIRDLQEHVSTHL